MLEKKEIENGPVDRKWSRLLRAVLSALVVCAVALSLASCNAAVETDNLTEVGISVTEEKLLSHNWIDGIASYDYTAVCNSHTPAKGERKEFTRLFVDGSGNAALGLMENGDWTFTVRAFNSHGNQLYEGTCRSYVSGDHLEVPIVLALRKVGEGKVTFNITARCTGLDVHLAVYWQSHDGTEAGSSTEFTTSCDGDIDTFTGEVVLPENRYSVKVEVYSADKVLATDITDLFVLDGEELRVIGVLDGQEDQEGAITPIPPKVPVGHIEVTGTMKSGKTVTATWVSEGETVPERMCWYLDGSEISDHGTSMTFVLPSPGMHYLTATAMADTESYSDEYVLNLASSPIKETGGVIIYDRGEAYGTYWFDEYREHYRIDDEGNGWRYIVAQVVDAGQGTESSPAWTLATSTGALSGTTGSSVGAGTTGTAALVSSMGSKSGTYTYGGRICRPAPAGVVDFGAEWSLPTKNEAPYIISAMLSGRLASVRFWTCTQYSSGSTYLADPGTNSTSAVSMTTGAGLVVVKYI